MPRGCFLAGELLRGNARRILAFADEAATSWFRGKSWMADALRAMGIEVGVVVSISSLPALIPRMVKYPFRFSHSSTRVSASNAITRSV
jgi:hypothetical protein